MYSPDKIAKKRKIPFWDLLKTAPSLLFYFKFSFHALSKKETNILKGIAILFVIFHNFFHWVSPYTGENEFSFSKKHIENFIYLVSRNPKEIIHLFSSYFGHYGVQVFIFLSGYGLTKSVIANKIGYFAFLGKRLLKIYPPFVLSVLILFVFNIYKNSRIPNIYYIKSLLLKLSLITNFLPEQALSINGPWWFFSLIFQLYLIFYILIFIQERLGNWGLLLISIISIALTILLDPYFSTMGIKVRTLFPAHIPEFCLGIYFAQEKNIRIPILYILLALAVFILGNVNRIAWYFSFLSFLVFIIPFSQLVIKKIGNHSRISMFLFHYGVLSLHLFALHGILRNPLTGLANSIQSYNITLLLFSIYLFFATFLSYSLKNLSDKFHYSVKH